MKHCAATVAILAVVLSSCLPDAKQDGVGSQGPTAPPAPTGVLPQPNIGFQATIAACPCPVDGGNITLVRTDTTAPWMLQLTLNAVPGRMYWVTRQLSPGSYQLFYAPPDGYQLLNNEPANLPIFVGAAAVDLRRHRAEIAARRHQLPPACFPPENV